MVEWECITCGKKFEVFRVKYKDKEYPSLECLEHYEPLRSFMLREYEHSD